MSSLLNVTNKWFNKSNENTLRLTYFRPTLLPATDLLDVIQVCKLSLIGKNVIVIGYISYSSENGKYGKYNVAQYIIITSHHITSHQNTLRYIIYYNTLHYTLNYVTIHYITLHYTINWWQSIPQYENNDGKCLVTASVLTW